MTTQAADAFSDSTHWLAVFKDPRNAGTQVGKPWKGSNGGLGREWPRKAARPSSAIQLPSMTSPMSKGHGSTAQSMRNTIPTVVNGDSPDEWMESTEVQTMALNDRFSLLGRHPDLKLVRIN